MKAKTLLSVFLMALLCISAPVMATDSNTDDANDQSSSEEMKTNDGASTSSSHKSNDSNNDGISADTATGEDDY